jgi:KipI family sensor histidine kinase inhibitor
MEDAANRAALAFRAEIAAECWPEVLESASTLVSAFFRIDLVEHAPDALMDRLRDRVKRRDWFAAGLPDGRTLWTIPAVFGGDRAPQFEEAAEVAGLSTDQALKDLLGTRLRVLTIGFAPGQPYLGYLPEAWNIPRQTSLSDGIPQGALVAAVQQMCLFSKDTPTGWRHVGQTAFRTFDLDAPQPFALNPGDEVQFSQISAAELARIEANRAPFGGAVQEVLG